MPRTKDVRTWHFDGLETFFNMRVASLDFNNLKLSGVRHLYRLEGST